NKTQRVKVLSGPPDSAERRQVWREPTGSRFSTPSCETDSEKTRILMGIHLQAEAGIDPALPAGTTTDRKHHDRVPEDDWEALSQRKKDKIRLKDWLFIMDQCT
ncbi:Hypothetical protein FKW44_011134, partial [Caligus rogercresseyi]